MNDLKEIEEKITSGYDTYLTEIKKIIDFDSSSKLKIYLIQNICREADNNEDFVLSNLKGNVINSITLGC